MASIRYYNDSDYDDLKSVLQEGGLYEETWETKDGLSRKIKKDPQSILIAELDGEVVGCVFIVEDGWNAFVWRLCVKNNQRKKGIGSLLMRRVEEIVKERGLGESSLFVDPSNDMLIKWYEKQGYKRARNWTFMFKVLKD